VASTGTHVAPVVGFIDLPDVLGAIQPNRSEVDTVFTLTLEQLLNPVHRSIEEVQHKPSVSGVGLAVAACVLPSLPFHSVPFRSLPVSVCASRVRR
jgi:hypothetical protein